MTYIPKIDRVGALTVTPHTILATASKYDVSLQIYQAENISGWLAYNPDLFSEKTARGLCMNILALAQSISQQCGRPIKLIRRTVDTELPAMMAAFNS